MRWPGIISTGLLAVVGAMSLLGLAYANLARVTSSVEASVILQVVSLEEMADIDGNGKVDRRDLDIIAANLGKVPPDDPRADVDRNGVVDLRDLALVGRAMGMQSPSDPQEWHTDIQSSALESFAIEAGDTVVWTNRDGTPHTVTSGANRVHNGVFNSGELQQNGTFSFTFSEPGAYPYFCSIHAGMEGVITVE